MRHPPYVAVIGPSEPAAELLVPARQAGEALATRGWVTVTGGLGGVMAAAAAGAASRGGTVVGLLPGDDRTAASAGHSVVIPTGLGELRNSLIVRTSDAVLSVGGSWGTQIEVSLAVRTGVPVVSIAGWVQPAPGVHNFDDVASSVAWLERRFAAA
ncbi:MAG: TIGR00725 family protein [Actinomycetota bacterium]|nr:TIGR00725 family protein [Nocardioidaceae bacterium]MDQ3592694.1 TIGR00725 family protein [Actinomycetota bacterium]